MSEIQCITMVLLLAPLIASLDYNLDRRIMISHTWTGNYCCLIRSFNVLTLHKIIMLFS